MLAEANVRLLLVDLVAIHHTPEGFSYLRQQVGVAGGAACSLVCQFVPIAQGTERSMSALT